MFLISFLFLKKKTTFPWQNKFVILNATLVHGVMPYFPFSWSLFYIAKKAANRSMQADCSRKVNQRKNEEVIERAGLSVIFSAEQKYRGLV